MNRSLPVPRHPAFDVVPQFLELPVRRVKPKAPLDLHNDVRAPSLPMPAYPQPFLCISRFMPVHGIDEPLGDDQ